MTIIKIALLQMVGSKFDQEASLVKGEAYCRNACEMGADVALFPEMWNIGYTFFDAKESGSKERWLEQAIEAQSRYVKHFQSLARELDMAIALTYLERWPGAPRNSVSLIDRRGQILITYAKVHTCEWDDGEGACTSGDDFYVADLDTKPGLVKIGLMICFDREHPESARVLMLKGAELILTPNACTLEEHRLGQFKARAYENMLGVAMANYAAPQENGHSVAYHPVCFGSDDASLDTKVIEAGEEEGIFLAEFDMDAIRRWREKEVWGNAFRKPRQYQPLVSFAVEAPFTRLHSRR